MAVTAVRDGRPLSNSMPFVRVSRDERGYENTFVLHGPGGSDGGRPRLLYWFRTPPNVRVGRRPLDEAAMRAIEARHPDLTFDWAKLTEATAKAAPPAARRPPAGRRSARRPAAARDADAGRSRRRRSGGGRGASSRGAAARRRTGDAHERATMAREGSHEGSESG